jgi:branched-chain amino acid transport system substrate-binding protein
VGVMAKQGGALVPFDVEGTGYGFKVIRQIKAEQARMPSTCQMQRPS